MTGKGAGDVTFDLTRVVPALATLELHSESSMAMDAGGEPAPMNTVVDFNLKLESK